MRTFTRKVALLLMLTTLLFGAASCSKHGAGKPSDVDYYTCTMHPSVKSQDPKGKCPICSMDLVPVMKKGGSEATETSPQPQGTKGDGEKQGGQMQGMEGMAGMQGRHAGHGAHGPPPG